MKKEKEIRDPILEAFHKAAGIQPQVGQDETYNPILEALTKLPKPTPAPRPAPPPSPPEPEPGFWERLKESIAPSSPVQAPEGIIAPPMEGLPPMELQPAPPPSATPGVMQGILMGLAKHSRTVRPVEDITRARVPGEPGPVTAGRRGIFPVPGQERPPEVDIITQAAMPAPEVLPEPERRPIGPHEFVVPDVTLPEDHKPLIDPRDWEFMKTREFWLGDERGKRVPFPTQRDKPVVAPTGISAFERRFGMAGGDVITMVPSQKERPTTGNETTDMIADVAGSLAGYVTAIMMGKLPAGAAPPLPLIQLFHGSQQAAAAIAPVTIKLLTAKTAIPEATIARYTGRAIESAVRWGGLRGVPAAVEGRPALEVASETIKGGLLGVGAVFASAVGEKQVQSLVKAIEKSKHADAIRGMIPGDLALTPDSLLEKYLQSVHGGGMYLGTIGAGGAIIDKKPLEEVAAAGGIGYLFGASMGALTNYGVLGKPSEVSKGTGLYMKAGKTVIPKKGDTVASIAQKNNLERDILDKHLSTRHPELRDPVTGQVKLIPGKKIMLPDMYYSDVNLTPAQLEARIKWLADNVNTKETPRFITTRDFMSTIKNGVFDPKAGKFFVGLPERMPETPPKYPKGEKARVIEGVAKRAPEPGPMPTEMETLTGIKTPIVEAERFTKPAMQLPSFTVKGGPEVIDRLRDAVGAAARPEAAAPPKGADVLPTPEVTPTEAPASKKDPTEATLEEAVKLDSKEFVHWERYKGTTPEGIFEAIQARALRGKLDPATVQGAIFRLSDFYKPAKPEYIQRSRVDGGLEPLPENEAREIAENNKKRNDEIKAIRAKLEDIETALREGREVPVEAAEVAPPTPTPAEVTPEPAPRGTIDIVRDKVARVIESPHARKERRAVERAAYVDDLTGLQNQRSFNQAKPAVDKNPERAWVFMDLRNLHAYNKVLGHEAGDEKFRQIGKLLRDEFGDAAFRAGGDEFAIAVGAGQAPEIAERLSQLLPDEPIKGTEYVFGADIGHGSTLDAADKMAAEVKAARKDAAARLVETEAPAEPVKPEVAPENELEKEVLAALISAAKKRVMAPSPEALLGELHGLLYDAKLRDKYKGTEEYKQLVHPEKGGARRDKLVELALLEYGETAKPEVKAEAPVPEDMTHEEYMAAISVEGVPTKVRPVRVSSSPDSPDYERWHLVDDRGVLVDAMKKPTTWEKAVEAAKIENQRLHEAAEARKVKREAPAEPKELWQMTAARHKKRAKALPIMQIRAEIVEILMENRGFSRDGAAQYIDAAGGDTAVRELHNAIVPRESVELALREGKPVPPEVLADYPDLKPVEPPAPPEVETVQQTWDAMTEAERLEITTEVGWAPRTAGKISRQKWDELTPAAKNVIERQLEDIPEAAPEVEPEVPGLPEISIEDIPYQLARDAYRGISFDPEKRAESVRKEYMAHMQGVYDKFSLMAETPAQKALLKAELERYRDNYVKRYKDVLIARSRTVSPMITGPAKFPTARNEKALDAEARKIKEFLGWDEKAQRAIEKKLTATKPPETIAAEEYKKLERKAIDAIATLKGIEEGRLHYSAPLFKSNLAEMIKRSADRGNIEEAKKVLEFIREKQKVLKSPVFTDRHSIWAYPDKAAERVAVEAERTGTKPVATFEGVEVVNNYDVDRTQILFDVKPPEAVRADLKKQGWKWSSLESAWQRKLTDSAERSAKSILGKHYEERVPEVAPEVVPPVEPEPVKPEVPTPAEVTKAHEKEHDEQLAIAGALNDSDAAYNIMQDMAKEAPHGWRDEGNIAKERRVKAIIHRHVKDPADVEKVFAILKGEEAPAARRPRTGTAQVADYVVESLEANRKIDINDLYKKYSEAVGATMASGAFDRKDVYDALELGVNKYMLSRGYEIGPGTSMALARKNLEFIQHLIMEKIPTQTVRSAEQDEYQQFSTPPTYAYIMGWVANVTKNDEVMEPSAGIGGLVVLPKAAGATVYVNELSSRRSEILKELGFDRVFTENAEQLDNILPVDVIPSVIIMNPPFSATAGRMEGKRDTRFAKRHIEQALARLEEGGRLVALVGRGMADDAPMFKLWWRGIKQKYNVRANIRIDGKLYQKYGTGFDSQMLVIDKTGPTPRQVTPVLGEVNNLNDLIDRLEGIKNDRRQRDTAQEGAAPKEDIRTEQTTREPAGERVPGEGRPRTGPRHGAPRLPSDRVGTEPVTRRPEDDVPDRTGEEAEAGVRGVRPGGRPATVVHGPADEEAARPGRTADRSARDEVAADPQEGGGVPAGRATLSSDRTRGTTDTGVKVTAKESKGVLSEEELSDAVYTTYKPSRIDIKGAAEHPTALVESAAMGAVLPPKPTYTPNLPEKIIKQGKLSGAQLETIVYAGQAHQTMLPDGNRRGFLIGDGTGVGKGREISGIILDNYRQGRMKSVWITVNDKLLKDSKRDFRDLGMRAKNIITKPKTGEAIKAKEGTLFMTYGTLRAGITVSNTGLMSTHVGRRTRIDQIVDWVGTDFDGVIAFDESHKMQNAEGDTASLTALAGMELQERLPNARVVYASATAATEVKNILYADRLGLWGQGTSFPNKDAFVSEVTSGGLAAMELIARDMKATGNYISRALSFEGVTYDRMVHQLTPEQTQIYDAMAEGWQIVLQNVDAAMELTGQQGDARSRMWAMQRFWSSEQRFFSQLMTAMQMPSVIESVKKDMENGHAVVMQLVNTNEATQERALSRLEEDQDLEELDLTPRDILMEYLRNAFPTEQYEEYYDEDGRKRTRPVLDSQGNPVINREAVAMRERLLDKIGALAVPDGPLEIVLNAFGYKNVAEVTGRSRRVVAEKDEDTGGRKLIVQSRTLNHVKADISAFRDDKKRVLIFSEAGGTGESYHADPTQKNRRKRIHYLIQAGWKADAAVQGFGRSHRTNQAHTPHYILVTTNLKGQMRFISSVARRLDQLGALTKGQRQTGSQGLFAAKDNLETVLAGDALVNFYSDLINDRIPGFDHEELLPMMGLQALVTERGNLRESLVARDVTRFLNRILALTSTMQNRVFDEFSSRYDRMIEAAVARGTLDTGMENFRADKVKVLEEKTVYTDEAKGAETQYVKMEASHKNIAVPFREIDGYDMGLWRNTRSNRIYAVKTAGTRTLTSGAVVPEVKVQGAALHTYQFIARRDFEQGNWERVTTDKEAAWEEALRAMVEYRKETLHLITGTVLPIWDRLPKGHVRVIRVKTDDGRVLLGRVIKSSAIDETLRNLGATREREELTPAQTVDRILNRNHVAALSNGWKVVRRRVAGENRIEILGPNYGFDDELERAGVFKERIQYMTRYFIPTGKQAASVFAKLTQYRPVVEIIEPEQEELAFVGLKKDKEVETRKAIKKAIEVAQTKGGVMSRQAIITAMGDFFEVPIRPGRLRGRDVLAKYKQRPHIIRAKTKNASRLRVITHELGHHLDILLDLDRRGFKDELLAIPYVAQLKVSKPSYKEKRLLQEGVAEFVYMYLMQPDQIRKMATGFYNHFEDVLTAQPDIQDKLLDIRRMIELYTSQQDYKSHTAGFVGEEPKRNQFNLQKAYDYVFDELGPVARTLSALCPVGHVLPADMDPVKKFQIARGYQGRAHMYLTLGQYEFEADGETHKKVGPALMEIVKPVQQLGDDVMDEFTYWLIIKRAIEVEERGKVSGLLDEEKGVTLDTLKEWAEQIEADKHGALFKKQQEELLGYTKFLLKRLVDAGVMASDTYNKILKDNQWYLPFQRIRPDIVGLGAGTGDKYANRGKGVYRFKGADLPIKNPWQSLVRQTVIYTNLAARNDAMLTLVNLKDHFEGTGGFFDKVPAPVVPFKVRIGEMVEALGGIADAGGYQIDIAEMENDEALERLLVTFFQPQGIGSAYKSLVTVWRDGRPEFYDFIDEDLMKAILHMDSDQVTFFSGLARKTAGVMRLGHIVNPRFPFYNVFRDQIVSTVYSEHGYSPLDFLRGAAQYIGKGEMYREWLSAGGAMATFDTFDKDYFGKTLKTFTRRKWTEATVDAINPLTYLRYLATLSEYSTNLGEYMAARRAGKHWVEASSAGRDITVDHGRHGSKTQGLRDAIPFFNSTLQGHRKLFIAFKKRPLVTFLKMLMFITLPTLGLYLINRNNPHYHELPDWRKDMCFNIPIGNPNHTRTFLPLPKPFLPGLLFGALPERFFTWMDTKDKQSFDGFAKTAWNVTSPNTTFWPLEIIYELSANKNFYTGAPIVPMREEKLPAAEQYGPYTTETAKIIGRGLNISPRKIDFSVRKVTGLLGKTLITTPGDAALRATGIAEDLRPARGITEIPIFGDFFTETRATGADSIDQFYRDLRVAETAHHSERGPTNKREQELVDVLPYMNYVRNRLTEYRREERAVHKAKTWGDLFEFGTRNMPPGQRITPEERRELLDLLMYEQINLVRAAYGKPPID